MTTVAPYFTIPDPSEARVPPALLFRVMTRDGFACVYCGAAGAGVVLRIDHVRPCAHFSATAPRPAVNDPTNLVTACEGCNGSKGAQDLPCFARMLRGRGVAPAPVRAMIGRVRRAVQRRY